MGQRGNRWANQKVVCRKFNARGTMMTLERQDKDISRTVALAKKASESSKASHRQEQKTRRWSSVMDFMVSGSASGVDLLTTRRSKKDKEADGWEYARSHFQENRDTLSATSILGRACSIRGIRGGLGNVEEAGPTALIQRDREGPRP